MQQCPQQARDVFRAEDAGVLVAPVQAPNANAYAERWIRTVRAECLDWLLIISIGHLEQVLRIYVEHYNRHRPHRALGLEPPEPSAGLTLVAEARRARVRRRDLLGGLLSRVPTTCMNAFTHPYGQLSAVRLSNLAPSQQQPPSACPACRFACLTSAVLAAGRRGRRRQAYPGL